MPNYTDGYTKVCGLIANPVKHTLSPVIHNMLAQMKNINLVYVPLEVPEGKISEAIKGAEALSIHGMNVTIPYKSDVIPYLEDIDPLAKGVGAVNTLVRTASGGYKGYNTDMTGLYRSLFEEDIKLEGEKIIILGAGGVARPVAFLCGSKGAEKVYVLNRTTERAVDVADEVNRALYEFGKDDKCTADGLSAEGEPSDIEEVIVPMGLDDYRELIKGDDKYIVFQCTSVGLFPDVNSAVIEDEEFYRHVSAAMDLVYRPMETKFLKLAKAVGAKTFSGLKMLLYQGIDAFEMWNAAENVKITKQEADLVYKSLVLEVVGASNIILEGFMGSGKSTVAAILADRLELDLMDTDEAIEMSEGRTISEIFEEEGENAFRDMETELLKTIVTEHWKELVISLGGGLPMREENRELLKKAGKVVLLRANPSTVYERLKEDTTRPLLRGDNPKEKIQELHNLRKNQYEAAADIVVDTDDKTPEEIADTIIEMLGI